MKAQISMLAVSVYSAAIFQPSPVLDKRTHAERKAPTSGNSDSQLAQIPAQTFNESSSSWVDLELGNPEPTFPAPADKVWPEEMPSATISSDLDNDPNSFDLELGLSGSTDSDQLPTLQQFDAPVNPNKFKSDKESQPGQFGTNAGTAKESNKHLKKAPMPAKNQKKRTVTETMKGLKTPKVI